VHLRDLLDQWAVHRDAAGFMKRTSEESSRIVTCAFGGRLLQTIGSAYDHAADVYLASLHGHYTLDAQLSKWSVTLKETQQTATAGLSVAKAALAANAVAATMQPTGDEQEREGKGYGQVEQLEDSLQERLPIFLQTLWDIAVVDISDTLQCVCNKVLKDVSIPWQLRVRRADALLVVARVFRDANKTYSPDLRNANVARQHLEEALMGSVKMS